MWKSIYTRCATAVSAVRKAQSPTTADTAVAHRGITRALTFAAGLAVVLAAGAVYGAWTQRWQKSADLEARAAKLRELPDALGPWKGRPDELDPESLAMAGAEGSWVRRFTDDRSGESLLVILLCGRP